ncbi:hypothetical protein ACROYT_G010729 [Oculina patagonica]
MFYGELAETRDSIELPDCEYESLLELFRYMYSDEVNLSGNNVMGVLYLAKKYIVPSLADTCTTYLQVHLDQLNVFSILSYAQKYDEKTLVDRCWEVIDKQTEEAVKSDAFATIERSLLEALVKRDTLNIKEVNLFKAVNLWATKECERQGLTADGEVKRRILGEPIIKGIRFPVMAQLEFANIVVESKLLTAKEVIDQYLEAEQSGFCNDTIHRCGRFQSMKENKWRYRGNADGIDFTVDKDIMLHGVCLFGRENNDYLVTITIKENYKSALVSKTGTFPSKLLQYKRGSFYGFEVLFDSVVLILKKNTKYQIEALISGMSSWCGGGGVSTAVCSGVTFSFANNANSYNGTDYLGGQFPEILFSVLPA